MINDNCNNMFKNMGEALLKLSEGMNKVVEGINVIASSKAMLAFIEFLQNIPDDIKETQLFEEVQRLNKVNLHYEDVIWIVDEFGLKYTKEIWKELSKAEKSGQALHQYMAEIVVSESIEQREKLIVLLAHIEPLIYETLKISKIPNVGLKSAVKKVSIDENEGMSAENLAKIYVLAVTYIIFARTDNYTEEIDKRIPFRNNILHNGIVLYSDEEVSIAYELLVDLIEILLQVNRSMYGE